MLLTIRSFLNKNMKVLLMEKSTKNIKDISMSSKVGSGIVLGIDFGTTNCVASYWCGSKAKFIKNDDGTYIFPSNIEFTKTGKIISNSNNNYNKIRNIKLLIGRELDDVDVIKNLPDLYYKIKQQDDKILLLNKYENKYYTLEELNSLILKNIITKAEEQLECKISDVVVSIPAHFNQYQRESTLVAIQLAQLNCIRIINEPTAAAMAYGLQMHNDINIFVFDLGGGTLDLSILNIDDGVFEVIKTYGDNDIGGELFTRTILEYVLSKFRREYGIDMESKFNQLKLNDLKQQCEVIKTTMNAEKNHHFVEMIGFCKKNGEAIDLKIELTNDEIDNLFTPIFDKMTKYLEHILLISDMRKNDVDYVILVGGATKLKSLQFLIESFFRKKPICSINPDHVVSMGCAIQGFILKNPEDEFSKDIVLLDVAPLSIGVESDNGLMTKIIKKGSKIPVKKSKFFKTTSNDDEDVDIKVYQGERDLVTDNYKLCEFNLNNLCSVKNEQTIIKVSASIDVNGIIKIFASERGKENNAEMTLETDKLPNKELIDKMIKESEFYKNVDSTKRKIIKLHQKITEQLEHLEYNCFNVDVMDHDKKQMEKFIVFKLKQLEKHIRPIKYLFDDDESDEEDDANDNEEKKTVKVEEVTKHVDLNNLDGLILILAKLEKMKKHNEEKYPSLILNYNSNLSNLSTTVNTGNVGKGKKEESNNVTIDEEDKGDDKFNKKLLKMFRDSIQEIEQSDDISKYSKHIISSYIANIKYKLESLTIDDKELDEYIDNYNNLVNDIINNDDYLIDKYSDLENIIPILTKNNIVFDYDLLHDKEDIEIFDIVYDISNKYNVVFE